MHALMYNVSVKCQHLLVHIKMSTKTEKEVINKEALIKIYQLQLVNLKTT